MMTAKSRMPYQTLTLVLHTTIDTEIVILFVMNTRSINRSCAKNVLHSRFIKGFYYSEDGRSDPPSVAQNDSQPSLNSVASQSPLTIIECV